MSPFGEYDEESYNEGKSEGWYQGSQATKEVIEIGLKIINMGK